MTYDVRWHAAGTGGVDPLEVHAAERLGVPADVVASGRLCARCGSSEHGRPWLRVDGAAHHASLSRSGAHLVTALADVAVGIDVESVAHVARGWDAGLVLADGESAGDDVARARAWARKEAVLKRRGTGLATPMIDVVLADEHWCDLDAPAGFVAAISLVGLPRPAGRAATSP